MSSATVDKIKERLNIQDVVGAYIKLEKAGASLKAKCPFHNEKSPSFFVSPARGIYYCFGCGAHGDIFNFVEEFEGVDFVGALKVLAARAGVELVKENPQAKSERERLFAVLEEAVSFYQKCLAKNSEASEYLKKRGLKSETEKEWQIGFAPAEWEPLYSHLKSKNFTDREIFTAGLSKKNERGGFYDAFRGRIMFPIFDSSGRPIGFSGRILPRLDDGKAGKYINSPETPLFNKSHILYGYHVAKTDIRLRDYSIVVEGQMDLIMSHQAGFTNTVASSGTALTEFHLNILKRHSNNVIFAFDSDSAGFRAGGRAGAIASALGMSVKMAEIKGGPNADGSARACKDAADLILDKPAKWSAVIKNAKHIVDFYLDSALEQKADERKLGSAVSQTVLPAVKNLESSIEQAHFIGKISEKTGIREASLWEDLKKVKAETYQLTGAGAAGREPAKKQAGSRKHSIAKRLFGIIYFEEGKPATLANAKQIMKRFAEVAGETAFKEFEAEFSKVKSELAFEAETFFGGAGGEKAVDELLTNLEDEFLRDEFAKSLEELSRAEKGKDKEKIDLLMKKCRSLSEKISKISEKRKSV